MFESIEIGFRPAISENSGVMHAFLVRRLDGVIVRASSAYPESEDKYDDDDSYFPPFGVIRTESNVLRINSYDRKYFESAIFVVLTTDDVENTWQKITETMLAVELSNFAYLGSTQNSNSAVKTALDKAGLSIPTPFLAVPGLGTGLSFWSPQLWAVETIGTSATHCFPADTPIQLASGEFAPIQSIRPSDNVASFHGGNVLSEAPFLGAK